MDNATLAIGIDLGTTNSLIAVWQDGAAQLIPNKFGEYLTPSIISMDENKQILVGKPADRKCGKGVQAGSEAEKNDRSAGTSL